MIFVQGLKKTVIDGSKELIILDDLSLSVNAGDLIAITGKSGSGKTTLLNILSLLDSDFSGQYVFEEDNILALSEKELFKIRKKKIANVFQNFHLIQDLTVAQNVEMPLGYQGMGKKERREIVKKCLTFVGLESKGSMSVYQLSGGEQQRVAIARALALKPSLLFVDEPTGNLDSQTSQKIMELLIRSNKDLGMTVILVTHDRDLAQYCPHILELKGGKLYEKI